MPSGPAVSAVGPWIADAARSTCVECHTQFGLFTRRHHCRRCGEIFCAKCCKYASKAIPGLEAFNNAALRVCKCCFLRHLSFMVVARKAFGVKFELFGSRADAEKYFAKCTRSKVLVQMSNGRTLDFTWESLSVRQRIEHKAQGARNFLLGGHQVANALVRDPMDHSRVSFTAESPTRLTPGAWCVVFTCEVAGQWFYSFIELRGNERQAAQDQFMQACRADKSVTKAVVFNLRGLTVMSAYSSGTLSRTAQVVTQAQQFVRRLPCLLVVHVGGHCTTRTHPTLSDGLDSIDQVPSECSAILFLPNFDVAARHRCDIPTFRAELENFAGAHMLPMMHNTGRVAVVSGRDVVTTTSNFATAVGAANAERITHNQAIVAVVGLRQDDSPHARTPVDAAANFDDIASRLRVLHVSGSAPEQMARPVRHLLPDAKLTQAARMLHDAIRADDAGSNASRSPPLGATPRAENTPRDACFRPTSSGRGGGGGVGGAVDSRSPPPETISCSICMEDYDGAPRRPVMCTSCGNTICLECWSQTRLCPMCRCEKPQRPVFNIALQHLLEPANASSV